LRADAPSAPTSRRLDQWLWFARFVKTRSLAARLCSTGVILVNGASVIKPNRQVRVGDNIVVTRGAFRRTVRVLALGARRGPLPEARLLYEELPDPVHSSAPSPEWEPLLANDES
jgi:ribosome-associated heat shock protein Hsp15